MTEEQRIRQEAARWLAALHAGGRRTEAQAEAAFRQWQAADPRHAEAIDRLQARLAGLRQAPLQDLGGQRLAATLATPSSRRRVLRGGMAVGVLAVGVLAASRLPREEPAAPELLSGIAERRDFTLADGSRLTLNADSRLSIDGLRSLRLQRGEMMLHVARSARGAFEVAAPALRLQSQENRLLVRLEPAASYVLALDAALSLAAEGGQQLLLQRGQWARRLRDGSVQRGKSTGRETQWLQGLLDVDNLPLAEVVRQLRPYFDGRLEVAPEVAMLRVSGIFPLDDSRHALRMLAGILRIRLVEAAPRDWVIEPA